MWVERFDVFRAVAFVRAGFFLSPFVRVLANARGGERELFVVRGVTRRDLARGEEHRERIEIGADGVASREQRRDHDRSGSAKWIEHLPTREARELDEARRRVRVHARRVNVKSVNVCATRVVAFVAIARREHVERVRERHGFFARTAERHRAAHVRQRAPLRFAHRFSSAFASTDSVSDSVSVSAGAVSATVFATVSAMRTGLATRTP